MSIFSVFTLWIRKGQWRSGEGWSGAMVQCLPGGGWGCCSNLAETVSSRSINWPCLKQWGRDRGRHSVQTSGFYMYIHIPPPHTHVCVKRKKTEKASIGLRGESLVSADHRSANTRVKSKPRDGLSTQGWRYQVQCISGPGHTSHTVPLCVRLYTSCNQELKAEKSHQGSFCGEQSAAAVNSSWYWEVHQGITYIYVPYEASSGFWKVERWCSRGALHVRRGYSCQ